MTEDKTASSEQFTKQSARFALWMGPTIAPLAWLIDLQVSFSADRAACEGHSSMLLHAVSITTLLIALFGVWLTWKGWRQAGSEWPGEEEGVIPRSRFLAFIGFGTNLMFVAAIIAQAVPKFMLNPCQ